MGAVGKKRKKALVLPAAAGPELRRGTAGAEIAVHGNDRPPPERAQHDPVEVVDTYVADAQGVGRRARAMRSVDLLGALARRGTITAPMARAGRRFASAFHMAWFDTIQTMDMAGANGGVPGGRGAEMSEARVCARIEVAAAMDVLGGYGAPTGRAAWFVIGCGDTIETWARRERFGHGRCLNPTAACGIVIGTLAVIEAFYAGLAKARKRTASRKRLDTV
jgi:hypothetical protein